MFISQTIFKSPLDRTVILLGDLHLPYLSEVEQTQIDHLASLLKNTPDSLLFIESGKALSNKLIELAFPNEAIRNATNFMLLGETKRAFKAQGLPFVDLGEKRPGENYLAFGNCINTITGQTIHFMTEEESVVRVKTELKAFCPAHLLGTVEEWHAHVQKEIAAEHQALKNLNPTTPAHIITHGKQRLADAEIFLSQAYTAAKKLRTSANESFLEIAARSIYNYYKTAQVHIGQWDLLKYRIGFDTKSIISSRVFFNSFFGFAWRSIGFIPENSALHYALADMDFAVLDEVQKTTAKTLFIATGAAHTIVLKNLLKGIGFHEVEERCTLSVQLPNAPLQELKKLPESPADKDFTKIIGLLSAQFGSAQMTGVYELAQEGKTAIGKKLNIFANI